MDSHGDPFGPKQHSDEGLESWLVTYADGITLILLFFLLLLSAAKFDVSKYDAMASGIMKDIAGRETVSPLQVLKMAVQDTLYGMQADQVAKVSADDKGVVVEFSSAAFFKPGAAEIREEALPLLKKLADTMKDPLYDSNILEIEGHTDDTPINTDKFPSNWELSGGRAASVIRFFTGEGMTPDRFRMIGFADTKPKVPNRDVEGKAIPENQSVNRRVTMHIFRMSLEEQKQREAVKKAGTLSRSGAVPVAAGDSSSGQRQGTIAVPPADKAPAKEQPKSGSGN